MPIVTHTTDPQTRFSAAAETYDEHSALQEMVGNELIQCLRELPTPRRLLDAGCGTGLLTAKLAGIWPDARIDALDLSAGMVDVARRKCADLKQVQWIVADLRTHRAPHRYDIIAGNSALQWLAPLAPALRHLASMLYRGGYLAFSAMTRNTLQELHAVRREVAPHKTPSAPLPAFDDFKDAISKAELQLVHERHTVYERAYPSAAALLTALHGQGVTGGPVSRGRQPLSRGELTRLKALYDERYTRANGEVVATYEVGIFVACRERAE